MPPLWWHGVPNLPTPVAAVLFGLAFRDSPQPGPRAPGLRDLKKSQWAEALAFCDREQLTLVLGSRCRGQLPPAVLERIESNFLNNSKHLARLELEYFQIAGRLDSLGIDHVLLKGFLQAPRFVPSAQLRMQHDLDILCAPDDLAKARQTLIELGFESVRGDERPTADHLPPMTKKTGWRWKGDYFDPEKPPVVELHFRLWDQATERFPIEGIQDFWERRTTQSFEGRDVSSLNRVDQLGYAAIHALRHLVRGDLKVFHIYELAYFLENHAQNELSEKWPGLHAEPARMLQTIPLLLAERWFRCRIPAVVREAAAGLPADVHLWLRDYAAAPVVSKFRPNKDELWLHFCLLPQVTDKIRVLRRRVVPLSLPGHVEGIFVPEESMDPGLRMLRWSRYGGFLLSRALFHLRSLVSIARSGLAWRHRSP